MAPTIEFLQHVGSIVVSFATSDVPLTAVQKAVTEGIPEIQKKLVGRLSQLAQEGYSLMNH